jgi:hypothetical protein
MSPGITDLQGFSQSVGCRVRQPFPVPAVQLLLSRCCSGQASHSPKRLLTQSLSILSIFVVFCTELALFHSVRGGPYAPPQPARVALTGHRPQALFRQKGSQPQAVCPISSREGSSPDGGDALPSCSRRAAPGGG